MGIGFVAIGDEVLRGETREGNGVQLAQRLAQRGVQLSEMRVVADTAAAIVSTCRELGRTCSLVITSGGLGPTDDDGTRKAMSELSGSPLRMDEELADGIRARYARLGRDWIALNLKQAELPEGALPLPNRHGTAPGFAIEMRATKQPSQANSTALVASLPGPPRELKGMLDDHLDDLLARAGIHTTPVKEHTLRLFGITESGLQAKLRDVPGYEQIAFRSLPSFPEIRLEVRAAGGHDDSAAQAFTRRVQALLGWRVFATERGVKFAEVLASELRQRDLSIAVAESCTGGLVGHQLTDVPGVSAVFKAGFVTYANEAKRDLLGVPWDVLMASGAVSEPVVRAMAEGARQRGGADWAVATSGIAGPGGGTAEKPVGTVWFGVAGPNGTVAHHRHFPGMDRWRFKRLAAWSALALLRRAVLQTKA